MPFEEYSSDNLSKDRLLAGLRFFTASTVADSRMTRAYLEAGHNVDISAIAPEVSVREYLDEVPERAESMNNLVNELLIIAENRDDAYESIYGKDMRGIDSFKYVLAISTIVENAIERFKDHESLPVIGFDDKTISELLNKLWEAQKRLDVKINQLPNNPNILTQLDASDMINTEENVLSND